MAVALVVALILTCAVCYLWVKQRRDRRKKGELKSNFYADISLAEKDDGSSSVTTETTTAYARCVAINGC